MGGPYLLGIDLGTTTCRCAIFDLQGHEVAAAAVEVRVSHPQPLWAEVDPEVWWQSTARVVRQALRRGREAGVEPRLIGGIGLSGLMHAPVLLDATGRPLVPAMLWLDQRCAAQCESLTRQAAIQGIRLARDFGTSQTAPKLRWLAEERPDVLARAAQFLLPKDFLRYRLTGAGGTDESDAGGTGLFDRGARAWARQLVRLTGLPEPALPHIRPATTLAGHVTPQAAAETGLQAGTPVAVGGGDTLCTRLGVGPLGQGEVCIYLGTAAWIAVVAAPEGAEGAGRPAVRTARGFGATATTGAALRWVRDLLGPAAGPPGPVDEGGVGATYDALTAAASDVPAGAAGLFFLPHLMGERGPRADPLARGALVGFTLHHGRGHVVRAVLEGTAYQLRRLVEARAGDSPPETGVACGGAARSALWMQLLADVLRLPLRVPAVVEAGALGAAILGGIAAGLLPDETAAARLARVATTYHPHPATAAAYDAAYARYCQLDDLLAPWFHGANTSPPPPSPLRGEGAQQ